MGLTTFPKGRVCRDFFQPPLPQDPSVINEWLLNTATVHDIMLKKNTLKFCSIFRNFVNCDCVVWENSRNTEGMTPGYLDVYWTLFTVCYWTSGIESGDTATTMEIIIIINIIIIIIIID